MSSSSLENGPIKKRGRRSRRPMATRHWQVTSEEPEIEWETTGPHIPMAYHSNFYENRDLNLPEDSKDRKLPPHWLFGSFGESLRGDYGSISLLLFLYLLQGIPLGLTSSIPLVLQSRHVSYHQQALFSFAYWPFSLKLLWAPIVDTWYSSRIGRRKSWLVPTQYLIGAFMLVFSNHVTSLLGDDSDKNGPNIMLLTAIFFFSNFLAATQDIAVDGWALTMLSKRNLGYASTCNAVGQTAGFFLGNAIFLSLESAEFCNKYLRSVPQPHGIVTLSGDFVYFWGLVFLVTTTLVLVFKREVDNSRENTDELDQMGIVNAYKLLWDIARLKPVLQLSFVLLTGKIAFAATDGITGLKLIEMGVPKDKLALLAIPLTPLQILLPWILGRYTAGPRALDVYLKAYPLKLAMGIVFAFAVLWTPSWKDVNGEYPPLFFAFWVFIYIFHQIASYSIFVALMAFYAQISDPLVGGTYMTLLNTINNLGGNWPISIALWTTDDLTWKECFATNTPQSIGYCHTKELEESCHKMNGVCNTTIDGYYILIAGCTVIGLFWWRLMRHRIERLQHIEKSEWSCPTGLRYSRTVDD